MKLKYFSFAVLVLSVNSCMWGTPEKTTSVIRKDTLAYIYKNIVERAPAFSCCGIKADSDETILTIKYPLFSNQPLLNDSIRKKMAALFPVDKITDTSFVNLPKRFLKFYLAVFAKKHQSSAESGFGWRSYCYVLKQDSSLTTFQFWGDSYQAGAYNMISLEFINWNTEANKKITLGDIFAKNYRVQLTKIADTIFRNNEKLNDTASLAAHQYTFPDNKFLLNDNFLITPKGIKFAYGQFEITLFAEKQIELFIPYNKIRSLLLPNTVVSQYIK